MTNREMRNGAAMAGAMLLLIPTVDVLATHNLPRPVHALVAAFGIWLISLWANGRKGEN